MTNDWLRNPQAVDFVRELLIRSGLPLEIRVSEICESVEAECKSRGLDGYLTHSHIAYKATKDKDVVREIDRGVRFIIHRDSSDLYGFELTLDIPIECKRREGVTVFGFPTVSHFETFASYVTAGHFSGASYINHAMRSTPAIFERLFISEIALVEFKKDKNASTTTPSKIHEENLTYKAGSALYDYIDHKCTEISNSIAAERLAQKLDLPRIVPNNMRFPGNPKASYTLAQRFYKQFAAAFRNEMTSVTKGNKRYRGRKTFRICTFIPIICLESDFFEVVPVDGNPVGEFKLRDVLLTTVRYPWSSDNEHIRSTDEPESLILITNPSGLKQVLLELIEWFTKWAEGVKHLELDALEESILEGIIYRFILTDYQ